SQCLSFGLIDVSSGPHVARHSLSYIQEIGNGWFGKVSLSSFARAVVKELKANASSKEQNEFLQQGDPYRVLQHPNILQCLGQCDLCDLIFIEYTYFQMNGELLQLQKMACEIAAGVTHMHKHNFLHSDLALRNCYLTTDLTVKVGDYGIGPSSFKVKGLGVTLWELFEGAKQPYPHLSDREVLHHVLKDQQVRLLKPQLDLPYSERWYEVLQFCWLPADKRATAEEVHRLLTYLRMQGQKDVEDDFEQRWSSLKPNPSTRQATVSHSSFPILEQFDEGREPDEVLTVTETSRGLSFEYVWEAAHFPDTVAQAENGRVPETLPVFDAHKASSGNDYFIKLEELDESEIGMGESHGAEGTNASEQHQYVVLQDVRLDESSTDADFFHQSIDSKDSYLQDSHIWSSSEHESPYHTNIFSEGDAKLEDSHSFKGGFMELPEMNVPKRDSDGEANERESSDSFQTSFLGVGPEAIHLEISDQESSDVMKLLNTEKLTENFLFLKDNSLLKDKSQSEPKNIQETMSSIIETNVSDSVNLTGQSLKSAGDSLQLKDELLDLVSPILDDFLSPLKGNETMVPFDILVTGQTCSNHLPDTNGSLLSPKSGNYSSTDSTSESVEVIDDSPSDSHQSLESATTDTQHMCIDAKPPSLEEYFEASKENGQYREISDAAELSFSTSPAGECTESCLTEGLTSSDSMSDIMELDKKTVNDIPPSEAIDQDQETLLDNLETHDMSSLLVSDVCLDQISQDSLLDDSTSSTLPTIENSAETPDSLDSLDMHKDVVHGQSLDTPVDKLQPPYKAADSGYETENLESPEWNSQPGLRDSSEENEMGSAEEPAPLVPPEIIISEVDTVPDDQVNDGRVDLQQEPVEIPLGGNYRDSAYFSDNEELDKKSDDISGSGPGDASFWLQSNQEADESQGTEAVEEHSVSETSPEAGDVQADLPELVLTTEEDWSQEKPLTVDGSDQTHSHAAPEHAAKSTTSVQPSTGVMVHAKLTRTYAGEITKKKEPDMEGRYLGKLDGSSLEYGTEDGMDADEEDENSDESDEDMRAYRLHSSSSECSEDDVVHPVPVIISDDSSSLNLKGLLKPKSLQTAETTSVEGSNGDNRRGVSFFDDVTVYLFDQPNFLSKAASDHSASRPGGTSAASKYFSPPPANRTLEQSWNSPSNYSRFSISPASIASFSLTHLTDSDIEQGGKFRYGQLKGFGHETLVSASFFFFI
uniref:Lemur tyrosine kinase 2 n=1 Tax=Cyprinus carpio TaxID=7962 RepID=A0A8C1YYW7_CYPCA